LISQIRILLGKELENYKGQDKESVTYLDEHFPTLKGLFFGFNRSVAYLPQSNSGRKTEVTYGSSFVGFLLGADKGEQSRAY